MCQHNDEDPISSRPTMVPPLPPPTVPPPGEYDLLVASTFKKPSPYEGLAAEVAQILAEISEEDSRA